MRRLWVLVLILLVCALEMQWWTQRDGMAKFARCQWDRAQLSTYGLGRQGIVLDASQPEDVAKLVRFMAGCPGDWRQPNERSYTPLFVEQLDLFGPSGQVHFNLSPDAGGTVIFSEEGLWRHLSKSEQHQLERMFPQTLNPLPATRPGSSEDLEFLLEMSPSQCGNSAHHSSDLRRYSRRKLAAEIDRKDEWLEGVSVMPVTVTGKTSGARVRYRGENPFSHLGILSGDVVIAIDGRPVAAQILGCNGPTKSRIEFLVYRAGRLVPISVQFDP